MSDDATPDTETDAAADDLPAESPAEDAPTEETAAEDGQEPDADEPDPEAELEQDLEADLEPSGPDAKRGPADVGRATPAKGGDGSTRSRPSDGRTNPHGGGGGGGGGRGGGGSSGPRNVFHFSLIGSIKAAIFGGPVASGNSATGINAGGSRRRRPAPARRPTAVARARGRR